MKRMKHVLSRRALLLSGSAAVAVAACSSAGADKPNPSDSDSARDPYAGSEWRTISQDAWRARLNKEKRDGTYHCAGCDLPLFASDTKFDSGTGWPSFFDAMPGAVSTSLDRKLIYTRTEYHCARCLGHQGHVFDDGPPPTGMRYCINSVSLKLKPEPEQS